MFFPQTLPHVGEKNIEVDGIQKTTSEKTHNHTKKTHTTIFSLFPNILTIFSQYSFNNTLERMGLKKPTQANRRKTNRYSVKSSIKNMLRWSGGGCKMILISTLILIYLELFTGLSFIALSILNITPDIAWIGWFLLGSCGTLTIVLLIISQGGFLK